MWTLYEPWFWQRVTFEDGTRSKRGEAVMRRGKDFRPLTDEELRAIDLAKAQEQAASM